MSGKGTQGSTDVKQKNVLNAPLHKHSANQSSSLPATVRGGTCTPSHPIAALLTASFLDFSARQGTDLRTSGIEPGARLCMQTASWKSAVDKRIDDVPRVKLESTHEGALEGVGLDVLKRYAAGPDRGREDRVVWPKDTEGGTEGLVREHHEIGGKEPRA
ncbi:hypothetical protein IQ07DRAFT_506527 [Pyrenochaeta sp. DS3sAY3a]|nr:hypothetical protein IQ07DRAFT_506527 [Pyrenochaeta sp. DS3sAY3a]